MDEGIAPKGAGLAAVLRRLALDPAFAVDVLADPRPTLDGYDLTAADLSALSLWLEHPEPREGLHALFELPAEDPTPPARS